MLDIQPGFDCCDSGYVGFPLPDPPVEQGDEHGDD